MSEDIREEIAATLEPLRYVHFVAGDGEPAFRAATDDELADALMPLVARIQADAVRHVLDGTILSMGDVKTSRGWSRGVSVYDSREHYDRGLPRPVEIHEWLAARADRLEQGDPS